MNSLRKDGDCFEIFYKQLVYGDEPFEETLKRLAKFKYDGVEIKGEPRIYDVKKSGRF